MTKRNERTGARVARIAGRILAAKAVGHLSIYNPDTGSEAIDPEDVLAVAGSALTQAAGKGKRRK